MKRPLPEVDFLTVWESYGGELVGPDRSEWRKSTCPLHEDGTASAVVNEGEGVFKCFTCDISGDVFTLIMEKERAGFVAAVAIAEGFAHRGDAAVSPQRRSSSLLPRRSGNRGERGHFQPPWLRR